MRYSSVNNFEIIIDNEMGTKIAKADVSKAVNAVSIDEVVETPPMRMTDTIVNYMWGGTILISFLVWTTCIVSLILNCVKKNVGKAVFAGVSLVVPIIAIVISTLGRSMYQLEDEGIGAVLVTIALILQIVVEILAFIFCFSKKKGVND